MSPTVNVSASEAVSELRTPRAGAYTHNFSAGPGALPASVLAEVRQGIAEVPGLGLGVLGVSHRSKWFEGVVAEAEDQFRALLGLGADYHVLFLQGGSTLQFSQIAMTLLRGAKEPADYLHTGYWSGKSLPEARREGPVRVLWSGEAGGFRELPTDDALTCNPRAPYLHYVSNETVEGLQFHRTLGLPGVPRVCDMSSDFLGRPIEAREFELIYAHAQKNLGPSGVTVVVFHDSFLKRVPEGLPSMLDYRAHAKARSIYNTPPVFAIHVVMLVARWLRREIGGLEEMARINARKAHALYSRIDASGGFYVGRAARADRSFMNVSFNLASPALEARFLAEADAEGFYGLEGHRSAGGVRASLYNAVTPEAAGELGAFMDEFLRRHG